MKSREPAGLLHGLGFEAVDEMMRAQRAGLLFLGRRGGEGGDFSAEDAGELDGEMAETANADYADAGGGVDPVECAANCRR